MALEREPRSRLEGTPRSFEFKRSLSTSAAVFHASVPQSPGMDELTARTQVGSRRMASAKSTTSRRTSSSGTSKRADPEHQVSPARWAGVAFVIAALVSAIVLAFVSPSQPGAAQQLGAASEGTGAEQASPEPSASTPPAHRPTVQPRITNPPPDQVTVEREIAVTVALPEEPLVPKRDLTLHIMLDGVISEHRVLRPETGGSVTVEGVRIEPGATTLEAVLASPAGLGPVSEAVRITLDTDKPKLTFVSPANKHETFDDQLTVKVASEPGAVVDVSNVDNKWDQRAITLGPTGQEDVLVRLRKGRNRIRATSVDQAGQTQTARVTVRRVDGKPRIKLKAPAVVKRTSLPAKVVVAVRVTDADGKPLEDATLNYSLGGSGRTVITDADTTNANGRSRWKATISPTSSPSGDEVVVTVTATSPQSGQSATAKHVLAVK